jgi:hypothetical protein
VAGNLSFATSVYYKEISDFLSPSSAYLVVVFK